MACATLKRSLEFDPVHSHGRPNKRRRCIPICVSPSTSPASSPSASATAAVATQCNNNTPRNPSPFLEVTSKLTPEKMAANLREEIRRLHRRKQLQFTVQSDSSDAESSPSSSPSASTSNTGTLDCRDKPLFTFRQVGYICERMLCEQETKIREEYEQILNMKLSEQYEAFVKFTYDQITRRFDNESAPSYLS